MARSKCFFDDVKKELECSVCQEQFSEINEPKILKCLHTFCKTCLEAWIRQHRAGELSCPTCRHITKCPKSDINRLPSNLFYKQMLEIVEAYSGQGQDDSPHCGNCDERKSLKFYCSDCNCFLCDNCVGFHKKGKIFNGHNVKEISNFKSSDVQDYARKASICKKHNDELRYYCDKCKICICRDCAILEHRDHNIISFEQGLDSKKSEITKRMQEVEEVGILLRQRKETLEKKRTRVDNSIDQATYEVHRFAEHCISLIRKHEAAVTKELLKRKTSFSAEFSFQVTALDEKMKGVNGSLEFGKDVLERNNLLEILNVEETLERRFQDFLSSPKFTRSIEMNVQGVKYVPSDISNIENELGKLVDSNLTKPSLSIAQGKGLTEGLQGDDCTFTIVTKDWQGKTTYAYSEIDQLTVGIQPLQTARVPRLSITDLKDGNYEVKYRPEDAGEFSVCIEIGGEAIMGSPFQLKIKESMSRKKGKKVGKRESTDALRTIVHPLHKASTLLLGYSSLEVKEDKFLVTEEDEHNLDDTNIVTIIVSGDLPSKDALSFYFENEWPKSGGGEILEMVESDNGDIVISFSEVGDLKRLLEGPHIIGKKAIVVARQPPKKKVPLDPLNVHVQGLNATTSEDCLRFYLEKFTTVEVYEVFRGRNNNALVLFDAEPDFEALLDKVAKDREGLEGKHLRLERVPVCSCIYVKGLRKETSDDTIELYFENHRKNGGGVVTRVERKGKGYQALVYFEDPSSVQNVIKRIHTLDQRDLEIKPYYPFLQ